MDRLNILHWVLFYNRPRILGYILDNYIGDNMHLGRAFTGDHVSYEYEYITKLGEKKMISIPKLGLAICLISKNFEVFDLLMKRNDGLISS